MNLAVLKKSRKKPEVGDIFALLPPDGLYVYGRLIATGVNAGGYPGGNLIYIYRPRSKEIGNIPTLLRGQLLLPPMMTNNLPWSRGYFQVIDNKPLSSMDRLPQHCFRDVRGWYFDEHGNRLSKPVEPIGEWVLKSFRTIDDAVSKTLGLPISEDD